MTYFQVRISPTNEGSSDVIVVDNFHPRWKEAAKRLLEGRIKEIMAQYSERIEKWARTPLNLDFSPESGLTHIHTPARGGLDLWTDIGEPKYRSHNIHGAEEVAAVTAVILEYISWLDFAIQELEKKSP